MKTKRKTVRVYMLISRDKYQLPLMVSDDIHEFAARLGKTPNTISGIMCHARKKNQFCRYVSVLVEDD